MLVMKIVVVTIVDLDPHLNDIVYLHAHQVISIVGWLYNFITVFVL